MVVAFLGILVSLGFLIFMAYRGHSVIVIAPIAALIAVVFSGAPLLASYTQIFMPALGGFIVNFFPLFLVGAIFGRLMSVSGFADDIARFVPRIFGQKQAIVVTIVITALLAYGGINAWVIAFTVMPIAKPLFKHANVSLKLMPAAIAAGMFTFATAALPGTPQIHNAIPTRFFGTTTWAAPWIGVLGSILMFILSVVWLRMRESSLRAAGHGYDEKILIGGAVQTGKTVSTNSDSPDTSQENAAGKPAVKKEHAGKQALQEAYGEVSLDGPSGDIIRRGLIGLVPVLAVVLLNAVFVYIISPQMDTGYLAQKLYGETNVSAVLGVWSVLFGLIVGILLIFLIRPRSAATFLAGLSEGARNAVVPALTTASEVGYGAVIAALSVFALITNALFGIGDNPLVIGVVATAVIAAITGSSSGGLSITLQTFGEQLQSLALEQGVSVEVLHRIIAMASVSFDSLPHNGAIVTLLVVCGLSHRQSYKDVFVVTVLVPFLGVLFTMGMYALVPGLV
ncbi:GntP family permease [Corynebacterium hindlerae]|uniref:GntP family permease n=1 Tax=Corynebacterium hindlerae TaxID=699041 RepID=UPI003AABEC0E